MAYRVRFYMDMNAREAMHVIELRTAPQGHPVVPPRLPADAPRDRRASPATAPSPTRCSSPITPRSSSNGCSRSGRSRRSAALGESADLRRLSRRLRPVARVLVEERQRLERPHPIEEQHAVEVIGFVLDDARREIVRAAARCASPLRSSARTVISRARGTRPRMSGMLRQPSQSSTTSAPTAVISGLMIAIGSASASSSSSSPASSDGDEEPQRLRAPAAPPARRRDTRPSCRSCRRSAAGSPAPSISAFSSGRAFARSTGMPHARDLQNRHSAGIILCAQWMPCTRTTTRTRYRFCPRCGGALERRLLKADRARAARLHALRLRLLPRSEDRRRHDHPRPASGRLVLVRRAIEPGYGKWVFPGGYVDRGEPLTAAAIREAREECGLDVRLDGLVNIYSYPGRAPVIVVYAATAIGGSAVRRRRVPRDGGVRELGHSVGRSRVPQHRRRAPRLPGRPAPSNPRSDPLVALSWRRHAIR